MTRSRGRGHCAGALVRARGTALAAAPGTYADLRLDIATWESIMAAETEQGNYQLISGVFTADEANEILMTLIQDKISFHKRNELSRRERFGEPDAAGQKRVTELKQTKTDVAAMIEQARSSGQQLVINCNIEVTLSPTPG